MVKDPVCYMDVDVNKTYETYIHEGKTFFFCSKGCKKRFAKNPDVFLSGTTVKDGDGCLSCKTHVQEGIYVKNRGPYCCEKCYFRDKFLGDILDNIQGPYLAILEAFVEAIDIREHEVGSHSYRVTQFSMVLSKEFKIEGRDLIDIYCGSLLHDLGKIGIPDAILLKQGRLTEEEQAVMKQHPEIGHRIISHIGYLSGAADIVHSHHEHFDGSGYPRGLKGEAIPLGARIFTISDTLDALTVDRIYRKGIPYREAREYIHSESDSLFDPSVVQAFLNVDEELKEFVGQIMF
ncbi:MAG: HD domain-containing phosphohydrolase [Planctomycetota bacterium]|jgi:HD-GYP domain-containing protein (c-di-GMP phosphodiesterase class II)